MKSGHINEVSINKKRTMWEEGKEEKMQIVFGCVCEERGDGEEKLSVQKETGRK